MLLLTFRRVGGSRWGLVAGRSVWEWSGWRGPPLARSACPGHTAPRTTRMCLCGAQSQSRSYCATLLLELLVQLLSLCGLHSILVAHVPHNSYIVQGKPFLSDFNVTEFPCSCLLPKLNFAIYLLCSFKSLSAFHLVATLVKDPYLFYDWLVKL